MPEMDSRCLRCGTDLSMRDAERHGFCESCEGMCDAKMDDDPEREDRPSGGVSKPKAPMTVDRSDDGSGHSPLNRIQEKKRGQPHLASERKQKARKFCGGKGGHPGPCPTKATQNPIDREINVPKGDVQMTPDGKRLSIAGVSGNQHVFTKQADGSWQHHTGARAHPGAASTLNSMVRTGWHQ